MLCSQEAEGIRAKGEAEAAAIQAKGFAEAEGMEKKAQAYQKIQPRCHGRNDDESPS